MTLVALDEVAIQRAKAGDLAALEHVYRAYEGTVYTIARRMCRTEEDAEDVLGVSRRGSNVSSPARRS